MLLSVNFEQLVHILEWAISVNDITAINAVMRQTNVSKNQHKRICEAFLRHEYVASYVKLKVSRKKDVAYFYIEHKIVFDWVSYFVDKSYQFSVNSAIIGIIDSFAYYDKEAKKSAWEILKDTPEITQNNKMLIACVNPSNRYIWYKAKGMQPIACFLFEGKYFVDSRLLHLVS